MWKKVFFYCFLFMFTFSFEDVSSTAAAAKGRNHSAEGDVGSWPVGFFIWQEISLSVLWFLFYFLCTQRQCETMHLRFLALDPCCSEEKYFFDLNRNMNMILWRKKRRRRNKKKKNNTCVDSSMNSIPTVCVQVEWEEHSWPVVEQKPPFFRRASLLSP